MVVDKKLEIVYDLSTLNSQQANQLILANEKIIRKAATTQQQAPIPKTQKQEGLRKIFGRKTFGNLVSFGSSPFGFIQGTVTKLIPFIGTALLVTGVIAAFVTRVDNFQKAFTDNVDDRIDVFRTKQQQAQIQAGLTQIVITSSSGSAEPRDAYNSFSRDAEFEGEREARFQLTNTEGVD